MSELWSFSRPNGLESGLRGDNMCSLACKIHLLTQGVKQGCFWRRQQWFLVLNQLSIWNDHVQKKHMSASVEKVHISKGKLQDVSYSEKNKSLLCQDQQQQLKNPWNLKTLSHSTFCTERLPLGRKN